MESCCQTKARELDALRERQSTVLWVVLGINALMFGVEFVVGWLAQSVALQADSLDMLGDTLVYGFSLFALLRSDGWKASAALLKGVIMAAFGLGVLGEAIYKLLYGGAPEAVLMGGTALLAFAANAVCLVLLTRHRNDDLNMRSTWLCSRNDILANGGVLLAAAGVYVTTSKVPDIVISLAITYLFLKSAWHVLREAHAELRKKNGTAPSGATL
ncbi:MAG: cation diffusion facilitator family transporter [Chloroflexota bacterium]|nr:cation diffusion facilitator family transporter [Chloroflexota bacterium]